MANNSQKKASKDAVKTSSSSEKTAVNTDAVANEKDEKTNEAGAPVQKITAKEIDTSQIVTVVNGFRGRLVYISPRTREVYTWDAFGDEQEMELRELRNAKSSAKKFFINNWFMFRSEDSWIIDYLGLSQYYKNALSLDDFDGIFTQPASELEDILAGLSVGQKKSVAYRAHELVESGEIDSLKTINIIEKLLGVELIEK